LASQPISSSRLFSDCSKERSLVKTITLLAGAAILLVDVFGSKSSVGGPMTDLLVSFIIMLAVGLYEAWGAARSVGSSTSFSPSLEDWWP
jgi:hypothetical protein